MLAGDRIIAIVGNMQRE